MSHPVKFPLEPNAFIHFEVINALYRLVEMQEGVIEGLQDRIDKLETRHV